MTEPATVKLLRALAAYGEASTAPRSAYVVAGLSVRSGNAALRSLREGGLVEGSGRWIRLSDMGLDAARQLAD